MATLVIHGTMTILSAKHARWWWDSWHDGGFLHAVASAMENFSGGHDVWMVNGRPVSKIPELQMKHNIWTGYAGQLTTHAGHYTWAGSDDYTVRVAGAYHLVRYLNQIAALAPRERIFVIAHSHGCNIVKMASCDPNLSRGVYFARAVFLACPHFESQGPGKNFYSYCVSPERFGTILNLYSEQDTVQVGYADRLPGIPGARMGDYLAPKAHRLDRDPRAAHLYENWSIDTHARGSRAHTVMHGAAAGVLAGAWLASNGNFRSVLQSGGSRILPLGADDVGE